MVRERKCDISRPSQVSIIPYCLLNGAVARTFVSSRSLSEVDESHFNGAYWRQKGSQCNMKCANFHAELGQICSQYLQRVIRNISMKELFPKKGVISRQLGQKHFLSAPKVVTKYEEIPHSGHTGTALSLSVLYFSLAVTVKIGRGFLEGKERLHYLGVYTRAGIDGSPGTKAHTDTHTHILATTIIMWSFRQSPDRLAD